VPKSQSFLGLFSQGKAALASSRASTPLSVIRRQGVRVLVDAHANGC
jgi:hypothetical protein